MKRGIRSGILGLALLLAFASSVSADTMSGPRRPTKPGGLQPPLSSRLQYPRKSSATPCREGRDIEGHGLRGGCDWNWVTVKTDFAAKRSRPVGAG